MKEPLKTDSWSALDYVHADGTDTIESIDLMSSLACGSNIKNLPVRWALNLRDMMDRFRTRQRCGIL